jgi:hypothetical protein
VEISLVRLWPGRKSSGYRGVNTTAAGNDPFVKLRRHPRATSAPTPTSVEAFAGGPALAAVVDDSEDALSTPFEDWCDATGTHPEAFGAWELFTQQRPAS